MSEEILNQAIAAIKAGDKKLGKQLLVQVLEADENNESAWLGMAVCVDDPDLKRDCLKHALEINPNSELAKRGLRRLDTPSKVKSSSSAKKRKKKSRKLTLVLVCCIASVCCVAVAIGHNYRTPTEPIETTEPLPIETIEPRQARLCCVACAEEGILINLWEHPADNPTGSFVSERGEIVGQVPHGKLVTITQQAWVAGEERYYYYVNAGSQQGWVSEPFVQFGPNPCPAQDKVW